MVGQKMTKSQAKKRLGEASRKLLDVYVSTVGGKCGANLTPAQINKINAMGFDLMKIMDSNAFK